ncbi:MAG: hypothetical protein HY323_07215 [Betaproteobacteria bacterium]|nr:hypothetical protein [Betaproteobacteria bacterium]
MVQLIAGLVKALIEKKAAGALVGLLASKTQWAATGTVGLFTPEILDLIARAMQRDEAAIGRLVLIMLGYLGTLWARWQAAKPKEVPVIVG